MGPWHGMVPAAVVAAAWASCWALAMFFTNLPNITAAMTTIGMTDNMINVSCIRGVSRRKRSVSSTWTHGQDKEKGRGSTFHEMTNKMVMPPMADASSRRTIEIFTVTAFCNTVQSAERRFTSSPAMGDNTSNTTTTTTTNDNNVMS